MKYKFINQQDYEDCGWACLAMMIEHHQQKRFSLYELKNKYNSNKNGLSFFDLSAIAQYFKLEGKGYETNLEMLEQNNHQMPFILNVTNDYGASHFVIINKIENGQAYISDPSKTHPQVLNMEQLNQIFLSKVLIFRKKGKFKFQLNKEKIWLSLKNEILSLILLSILSIAYNFLWLWTSRFVMEFSTWITNQKIDYSTFATFALMALGSIILEFIYYLIQTKIFNNFYLKIFKQTLANLKYKNKGIEDLVIMDSLKEMNDYLKINFLMMETLINLFSLFTIGIVCVIWIWNINSSLVFFSLLMLSILLLVKFICNLTTDKFQDKKQYQEKNTNQNLGQFVKNYKLIKDKRIDQNLGSQVLDNVSLNSKISNQIQIVTTTDNLFHKLMNKIIYFLLFVVMFTLMKIGSLNFFDVIYVSILNSFLLNLAIQHLNPLMNLFIKRKNFHLFENYFLDHKKSTFQITQNQEINLPSEIDEIYNQANNSDEIFILTNNDQLIFPTIPENIFLGNKEIDKEVFNKLDLINLLKANEMELMMDIRELNNKQKQLINFLAIFFAKEKYFLLIEPLNLFSQAEQRKYLDLFEQLRIDCKYIYYSNK
ncbi:ABC transporter ATP-binding protein/permease [Williamsoniiplasma luminosum]|uniref:ABC transporter ATP-binding protein/permease n=1 Tax=Williamsoniiplasma luminosum TaxID=214888 RepID=A0A2K8NX98_9MOLU|nr:cysteine peptidase family C39 domain-containing protein [Williamsoniiplasma luminosum]ATZ17371.1 ABC transporter ATP-binding protein/permease [Williamsoniiplasma luminosum]